MTISGRDWLESSLSQARKVVDEHLAARIASRQGLKTKYFDDWRPELDEALHSLPEEEILPHELFISLMKASGPVKKKIILVTESGIPVAVVGLKHRWGHWEPVTQWIVPGVLFPVKEGYVYRVLAALGIEVKVALWRWETPPPRMIWMKDLVSSPTYGMRCSEDFETHWRKSANFIKSIRVATNRCRGFEFKINTAKSSEWIIKNWDQKWRGPLGLKEGPDLADRLFVAQHLQKIGLHHSLLLLDREEPAAGITFITHRNNAVAHCSFRNPEYDWHAGMTRLLEMSFSWVKDMGFDSVDLGGSFDYKQRWASALGVKWEFNIRPEYTLFEERAYRFAVKAGRRVKRNMERLHALNPDRSKIKESC